MTKPEISEKQFGQQFEDLLNLGGWRWYHSRPARIQGGWRTALSGYAGPPDYLAVRGKRVLWAELKVGKNKPSPAQENWLEALADAGQEVYVFRPEDWDELVGVLSR